MPNLCVAPSISIVDVNLLKQINTKSLPLRGIQGSVQLDSSKRVDLFFMTELPKPCI